MDQTVNRSVELSIKPATKDLGGFQVRRALPDARRKLVGPFIFFDHMGPTQFAPGAGIDVRAHPHIGIATITYLFEGQILHRDSLGYEQLIMPGAVNWMTAGRGIVHSERTPIALRERGSAVHGIQSWVALPLQDEECDPSFEHYPAGDIPATSVDGADIRMVIGSGFGVTSPVRTASETLYAEIDLGAGVALAAPPAYEEQAVYVAAGAVRVSGRDYAAGTMAVAHADATLELFATSDSKLMLLGGARLDGDRTIWWNFVSSSKARIEQAKSDWKSGRFDPVEGESDFIPLPES